MTEQQKIDTRRSSILRWLVHCLILFSAIAGGVGLIYWLQPPKPPGALIYELLLVTADKPIRDFTPHFETLRINAASGVVMWTGGDMVGNIQFTSTPGMRTKFNMVLPNQSTPFPTLTGMQFENRGDLVGDRLRTSLKLGLDNTDVTYVLNLGDGEYRAIELVRGEEGNRRWCYGIIKVEQLRPLARSSITFPNPAPPAAASKAAS